MSAELIISLCLGIGLSAASGFRVFVPLLVAAVAGRMGILPISGSFQWMMGWPAILCFGTATLVEILAYKIPFVDNLLDLIATPMAVLAGTLLAVSVLPVDPSLLKWVTAILIGGGSAGLIQTGTSMLRLLFTKTTAGIANPVFSTGESIAAFGTSITALFVPVLVAVLVVLFIFYLLFKWLIPIKKERLPNGRRP